MGKTSITAAYWIMWLTSLTQKHFPLSNRTYQFQLMHIPTSFEVYCGHIIKFWSKKYKSTVECATFIKPFKVSDKFSLFCQMVYKCEGWGQRENRIFSFYELGKILRCGKKHGLWSQTWNPIQFVYQLWKQIRKIPILHSFFPSQLLKYQKP